MNLARFFAILILFCPISIFSQTYLNESCKWYEFSGDTNGGYLSVSKFAVKGDTLVDNKVYWKILEASDYYYWGVFGGDTTYTPNFQFQHLVREDSSSFYRWTQFGEEHIVSFDYEIGDSILVWYFGTWETIVSIETIEIGGETRKVFTTDWGSEIYEGIGGENGILYGLQITGDESYSFMKCFSLNGEWIEVTNFTFGHPQVLPCDEVFPTISQASEPRSSDAIVLHPNPTNGQIHLSGKFDFQKQTVRLFDLAGKEHPTHVESIGLEKMTVSLGENSAAGMYFLSIGNEGVRQFFRVVKQ